MTLWPQLSTVLAIGLLCWGLGWLTPIFAFPGGQAALLLIWGFAPWWAVIPLTAVAWTLLLDTFGLAAWPLLSMLALSAAAAIPIGHWMREGRGPVRALIVMPFLIWGPWLLWRTFLNYSALPHSHLGWVPPGMLSMFVIWGAVIWVREFKPKRRSYRLSDAPQSWRGTS